MPNTWRVVFWIVLFILLATVAGRAQSPQGDDGLYWIPVVLHLGHSNFSDGEFYLDLNIKKAKALGAQGVGLSDHAETIEAAQYSLDLKSQMALLGLSYPPSFKKQMGINNMFQEIAMAGRLNPGVVIVYGTEVGIGNERHCHVGFYSTESTAVRSAIAISQEPGADREENITRVLSELRLHGGDTCFLVANHPNSRTLGFPPQGLRLVNAVEIFNHVADSLVDNPSFTMALAVSSSRMIVSGADYHGDAIEQLYAKVHRGGPLEYFPQLMRFTMVGTKSLTSQGVIEGLRSGRCYGAFGPARVLLGPKPLSVIDPNLTPRIAYQLTGLDPRFGRAVNVYFRELKTDRMCYAKTEATFPRSTFLLDLKGYLKPSQGNNGWIMGVLAPGLALNGILILPFNDPSDIRDERVALERYRPVNAQTPPPEVEQQPQIEEDEPEETDTPEERDNDDFWGNLARGLMLYLELSGLGIFGPRPGDGRDDEDRPNGGDDEPAMGPEGPLRIPVAPRR